MIRFRFRFSYLDEDEYQQDSTLNKDCVYYTFCNDVQCYPLLYGQDWDDVPGFRNSLKKCINKTGSLLIYNNEFIELAQPEINSVDEWEEYKEFIRN